MNELSDQKSISNKGIIIKKLKKDFEEEEISYCYDWIKKWEKIKFQNYRLQIPYTVSISDIRQFVLRNCLLQLTLNVTEDCNFRCKYCVYSNNYKYTRHHSDRYMYFSIAKKSIDHFFSLTKEGLRYNPLRVPAVGFYGGEPLLNFDLIKECVEYIEDKYKMYHTHYVLTTNGSLLDEEKANWLMQYDFSISISLDGPEDEHDRLRVYRSGHGTFQDIMSNIKPIMDAKYKKIHSQTVFDWKSDLFKIDEFFNRSDVPHITGASIVNNVGGCKYYNRFSEEDNTAFMKRLEEAKIFYLENHDYYKSHAGASFFDLLFGKGAAQVLFGPGSLLHPFSIMPFTGTCVPGRKIFVDVEGGLRLSSGEKQKIALARAILKDSPIILLDEVTKSIDVESRRSINEVIKSLKDEKTLIIITHNANEIESGSNIIYLGQMSHRKGTINPTEMPISKPATRFISVKCFIPTNDVNRYVDWVSWILLCGN